MNDWVRRIRGALGMAITWGIGGAVLGGFMEVFDAAGQIADIWPAVLGLPAFLAGGLFSAVLGIAGRNRRFDELSLPRFAAWGALGGAILGGVVVGLGATQGLVGAAILTGITTVGSAAAAAATLFVARWAEDGALLDAGSEVDSVGLSEKEARALLGPRDEG